ncbi:hypothetical protein TWF281_010097 [Arthrobotrys megalospora]
MFRSGQWRMLGGLPGIQFDELIDFVNGGLTEAQITQEINKIRRGQLTCKNHCKCDDEGEIVENQEMPNFRYNNRQCTGHVPNKCVGLWGCSCNTILRQPQPTVIGATAADYQRALDMIPRIVQITFPNYEWMNAPGGRPLRFTNPRYFEPGAGIRHLAPGSTPDDPIWLEGPSRKSSPHPEGDGEFEEDDGPLWSPGSPDGLFWNKWPPGPSPDFGGSGGTSWFSGGGSFLEGDWPGSPPTAKRDTIPDPRSNPAEGTDTSTDDLQKADDEKSAPVAEGHGDQG